MVFFGYSFSRFFRSRKAYSDDQKDYDKNNHTENIQFGFHGISVRYTAVQQARHICIDLLEHGIHLFACHLLCLHPLSRIGSCSQFQYLCLDLLIRSYAVLDLLVGSSSLIRDHVIFQGTDIGIQLFRRQVMGIFCCSDQCIVIIADGGTGLAPHLRDNDHRLTDVTLCETVMAQRIGILVTDDSHGDTGNNTCCT